MHDVLAGDAACLVGELLGGLARGVRPQPLLELARGHVHVVVELLPEVVVDLGVLVAVVAVLMMRHTSDVPPRRAVRDVGAVSTSTIWLVGNVEEPMHRTWFR